MHRHDSTLLRRLLPATVAVATMAACTSATPASSPSVTPAAVITITASGVSPKSVTVPRGSQVQFVNNDARPHTMSSNPHPEHSDCPELNDVGYLAAGQARQTGNLNTARTCGYHDHDLPANTGLQGSIVIQ